MVLPPPIMLMLLLNLTLRLYDLILLSVSLTCIDMASTYALSCANLTHAIPCIVATCCSLR